MDDLYDKIREFVRLRKGSAEKGGFGFKIPSAGPNAPKKPAKTRSASAS